MSKSCTGCSAHIQQERDAWIPVKQNDQRIPISSRLAGGDHGPDVSDLSVYVVTRQDTDVVSVLPDGGRCKRRYPLLAGAAVGFVTGVLGVFATTNLYGSPIGGFVGAIGCGVTAVALSENSVTEALVNALVADVVSSIAFFLFAVGGYLTFIWATEGITVLSAISFSSVTLLFGLGVAVPVGIISLCLAGLSGAVTALVLHPRAGSDPSG